MSNEPPAEVEPPADPRPGDAEAPRAPARPATLPRRRLALVAAVGVALFAADQLTKTWAQRALDDGPVSVIGSLQFNLLYNPGVAFSLGNSKGLGPWISVLALAVVVTVSLGSPSRTAVGAVASGLISGGALGNLADRAFRGDQGFLHGSVVDFIDLQWWPVFNLADAAIVVGASLLVLAGLRAPTAAS